MLDTLTGTLDRHRETVATIDDDRHMLVAAPPSGACEKRNHRIVYILVSGAALFGQVWFLIGQ